MRHEATFAWIAGAMLCGSIAAGCSAVGAPPADVRPANITATSAPTRSSLSAPSASTVSQLAPSGKLRAAINFGNPILAKRDAAGQPAGVSVDLSRELAQRLGVPIEFVTYDAAGKVVEGLQARAWDVAFIAIDPARAVDIDYAAAYVVIEGASLAPPAR